MSIASVGGNSPLNQMLLNMLSRLQGAQQTTPDASTASTTTTALAAGASCKGGQSKSLTGQAEPQLSGDVLRVLLALQEQSGIQAGSSSTASATATAASLTASDPAQQLFSAMDSDGNGTVSQSEMESYIENLGGTQQQADSLYSSLNMSGTAGLTEAQLASAATQGAGGHHHHHHHGGLADHAAQDLIQAADSNGDNALDQSEFESFVTKIGGTTSEADQDFAALAPDGSGSVTGSSLAQALKALDASKVNLSDQTSPILSVLDAIQKQSASPSAKAMSA